MDVYLRFVNAWYSKEFIEVFLHPQDLPANSAGRERRPRRQCRDQLRRQWRMEIFYLLVRLQKYFPLCPRRTLLPEKKEAELATTGAVL